MSRVALAAFAALWPGALVAQDWTGVWTADPAWCRYADVIGTHDPAPIRLTATRFSGLENACDIVEARRLGGLEAWMQRWSCMGEGVAYEEERVLMMGGTDELWIYGGFGAPLRLTRCPGQGG